MKQSIFSSLTNKIYKHQCEKVVECLMNGHTSSNYFFVYIYYTCIGASLVVLPILFDK